MGTATGSKSVRFLSEGKPGEDSVRYWISFNPSVSNIRINKDGSTYPSSLTAKAMKQVGSGNPVDATDCSLYYLRKQYNMPVEAETPYTGAISISSNIEYLIFRLRKSDTVIYETTLLSIEDGKDGQEGKPGADGQDGADGQNAIFYEIEFRLVNNNTNQEKVIQGSIPADSYGNLKWGTGLRVYLIRIDGQNRQEYLGRIKVSIQSTTGTTESTTLNTYWGTTNFRANYISISVDAYDSSTDQLLCSAYIAKVYDGTQGINGCVYRQMEWHEGVTYRNDADLEAPAAGEQYRYIDIVGILDGENSYWFECRTTHTSTSSNKPKPTTTTTEWKPLNNLAPTYTPLLLADNAEVSLIGTRQILIKTIEDGETKIVMGFTGKAEDSNGNDSQICAWVGPAPTSPENTLVIRKDGTVMSRGTFAVKAQELGIITTPDADNIDDHSLMLYDYFDKKIFNFQGTAITDNILIILPSVQIVNTTNLYNLNDGVEFSFYNQPTIYDLDGRIYDKRVIIKSKNRIYWNRNFRLTYSSTTAYTNGEIYDIVLPAYSLLRMRAVRQYDTDGSYYIAWVILNGDDFYAKNIDVYYRSNPVTLYGNVHLYHKLCNSITESEGESEGITYTDHILS